MSEERLTEIMDIISAYPQTPYYPNICNELIQSIINLQQENEKLNHYKLLYQKVKERNDKAIEYIDDYGHGYDCTGDGYYCLDEDNQKKLLEILKGNNEE